MRGGALPVIAWGTLLLVLLALNWVWTGDAIQVGEFGFAVLATYGGAALLWRADRQALRRGPPQPRSAPEAVPDGSLSAVLLGLSVAAILFGLTFGKFIVYFGTGVLMLSLGRMTLELRSQRETLKRLPGRRR